jgi:hypothetical protein
MPKRDDPVTDVAKKSKTAYDTLNEALGGPDRKAGSYDRKGKMIPGTQPKPAPKKPVPGSYDRTGKLIPGSEPKAAPKKRGY